MKNSELHFQKMITIPQGKNQKQNTPTCGKKQNTKKKLTSETPTFLFFVEAGLSEEAGLFPYADTFDGLGFFITLVDLVLESTPRNHFYNTEIREKTLKKKEKQTEK